MRVKHVTVVKTAVTPAERDGLVVVDSFHVNPWIKIPSFGLWLSN